MLILKCEIKLQSGLMKLIISYYTGSSLWHQTINISGSAMCCMAHNQSPKLEFSKCVCEPYERRMTSLELSPVNVFPVCPNELILYTFVLFLNSETNINHKSVGRAGRPPIRMSVVRSPAPPVRMSKCPWARFWTPKCSWWLHHWCVSVRVWVPDEQVGSL